MIKSLVKVLVAVLIANALWRVSSAYITHYRFNDAVDELATHAVGKTDAQLKDKVMELAATYDEPVDPDALTIRQEEHHTYVETKYTKPVLLFPGYEYQWPFSINVDGFLIIPARPGDLVNPK
jgi:hypothetical protein